MGKRWHLGPVLIATAVLLLSLSAAGCGWPAPAPDGEAAASDQPLAQATAPALAQDVEDRPSFADVESHQRARLAEIVAEAGPDVYPSWWQDVKKAEEGRPPLRVEVQWRPLRRSYDFSIAIRPLPARKAPAFGYDHEVSVGETTAFLRRSVWIASCACHEQLLVFERNGKWFSVTLRSRRGPLSEAELIG
jgi:hypothetical protein